MNDVVDPKPTGDTPAVDPAPATPPAAPPAPAAEPAPATPPPGENAEVEAFKTAAIDERRKRQEEKAKRKTAEAEMERMKNEQATKDYDPLDPESVQNLVRTEAQKIADKTVANQKAEADQTAFNTRIEEGQKKYPDVNLGEVMQDQTLLISDSMADIIRTEANGIDLLVHLNANRELSQRISQMLPTAAAMEMGRISESIKDAGPQLSNAPDPITPVGSRPVTTKDPDDMNHQEYEAYIQEKNGGSVFPRR